jgi:hypothetical protein
VAIVAEHVEARARGREQHCIAGSRERVRRRDGLLHRLRAFDRDAGACERGGDGLRIAADHDHGARMGLHGRRERGEVLALPVAPGDQHHRLGEPGQRRDRGAHVGALGIVVEAHGARLGHQLHAVRQAPELADRARHRLGLQPDRRTQRMRGERVGRVVQPRHADLVHAQQLERPAPQVFAARIQAPLQPVRRLVQAEREQLLRARGHGHREGVVAVQHARAAIDEDALLRRGIPGHRVVAVEVVLRQVEHRGGVERERGRGLQLVARKLHDPRLHAGRAGRVERVQHRLADVAHGLRTQAGGARHLAGERRHGRLAVGAGDP